MSDTFPAPYAFVWSVKESVHMLLSLRSAGNAERPGVYASDHDKYRGQSKEFARRVSRWYLMETSRHDRIVIEEDLRESRYTFEVPSQVR